MLSMVAPTAHCSMQFMFLQYMLMKSIVALLAPQFSGCNFLDDTRDPSYMGLSLKLLHTSRHSNSFYHFTRNL